MYIVLIFVVVEPLYISHFFLMSQGLVSNKRAGLNKCSGLPEFFLTNHFRPLEGTNKHLKDRTWVKHKIMRDKQKP